ncbi:MAG: DoxX family protein [Polyangiales bacterium]
MNTRTVAYWTTTGLFAAALSLSGIAALSRVPAVAAGYQHLGYPLYFMSILGAAKLLGVFTLLAPGLPRLKEWAYAGFAINLVSASVSHLAAGDPAGPALTPVVLLGVAMASWALRPEGRTLAPVLAEPAPMRVAAAAT